MAGARRVRPTPGASSPPASGPSPEPDPWRARGAAAIAHDVRMPLAVTDERFFAREHELYRPTRLPDQEPEQTLDGHVFLAPEATADVRALEPHPTVRELKDLGHVAIVLEHLGAHAEHQHALGVDPADPGLGLHIDVIDERRAVRVLDDDVGPREALADVAAAQMPAAEEVAGVVDPRCVWGQRGKRIVDTRQLRVFDLDEIGSGRRDLRRRR